MPHYTSHLAFGKSLMKHLNITDENAFLIGNLMPDFSTKDGDINKMISHFKSKEPPYFTDLNLFLSKYKNRLNEDMMLGIYAHLYLDYYFYKELFHDRFKIDDENVLDIRTNTLYTTKFFFSDDGYYSAYSELNPLLIQKYDLNIDELDIDIPFTDIYELDNNNFLKEYNNFKKYLTIHKEYTGTFINFNEIVNLINRLTINFIKSLDF